MKQNLFKLLALVMALTITQVAFSKKKDDYGILGTVEISKSLNKSFDLSLTEEVRFNESVSNFNRSKTSVELDYTILRRVLSTSVRYDLLAYGNSSSSSSIAHRGRYALTAQYRGLPVRFKLRTALYSTWRGSSVEGSTNPRLMWRNKLTLDYNFKKQGLRPYLSGELFVPLNGNKSMELSDYRAALGLKYRTSKASTLDFFVRYQQEVNRKNPDSILYGGIGWNYSF